jgi:hypothetical protein
MNRCFLVLVMPSGGGIMVDKFTVPANDENLINNELTKRDINPSRVACHVSEVPTTNARRLRYLAEHGRHGSIRKPSSYIFVDGGCSYYWECPHSWKDAGFSEKDWDQLSEFARRYRRFYHHCKEVLPGWTDVPNGKTYWADNSITQKQVNRAGETREVMLAAPCGDACY